MKVSVYISTFGRSTYDTPNDIATETKLLREKYPDAVVEVKESKPRHYSKEEIAAMEETES